MSPFERGIALAGRIATASVARLRGPRLSTLIFHRVLCEPDPMFPGEIDALRFEKLMRIVAGAFQVLPLEEAVARLAHDELPPRALSISFDDGYADNHDVAMPVLQSLGLPATVFVATSFLDGGRMWNDTVIECLRGALPERIDLEEFGLPAMPSASAVQRRAVVDRLLPIVKYQLPDKREPMLQRLHALCGHPKLPTNLMLTSQQVRMLRRGGMGVGAHTVRHPILSTLPDELARSEIGDSRSRLQDIIDAPVTLFAYPNGVPGKDYDDRHAAMVQTLGFAGAFSTQRGVARSGDDMFRLPRYTPWESGPLRWATRLVGHHLSA